MSENTSTTRIARCSCGAERPSSPSLAFFESAESSDIGRCVCGYAEVAHSPEVRERPHMRRTMGDGHPFTQRPIADHDRFYCGCRGWD